MFAASFAAGQGITDNAFASVSQVEEVVPFEAKEEVNKTTETLTTKEIVDEYFADIPIMADVAYCESRYRQFNPDGSVLRGDYNPADVGVMQINEKYHLETATKLGLNIHTLPGNMAYARYLYEKQGTRPWNYSSGCWGKTREVALK